MEDRRTGRIVLFAVLAVLTATLAAYFLLPAVTAVSDDDIYYSINAEVGGATPRLEPCTRVGSNIRRCWITDEGVSGYAIYRVVLDGDCWSATKTESHEEFPLPSRAEGCVDLDDQLRLGTRLSEFLLDAQ